MPCDELSPFADDAEVPVRCTDRRADYFDESLERGETHVEYIKEYHLAVVLACKPAVTECEVTVDNVNK